MSSNHIFRRSALEAYQTTGTKVHILNLQPSRTTNYLWMISLLASLIGGIIWTIHIPTYASSPAIYINVPNSKPQIGFFLTAEEIEKLKIGDNFAVQTESGRFIDARVVHIEVKDTKLSEIQQEYKLDWDNLVQIISKDTSAVFIVVSLDLSPEIVSLGTTTVQLQTGSKSLLTFMPVIGQYFR
jgi:hypothetical protein